jgi:acetoin utilization deacetylase AcuC-like enzyme
MHPRGVQLLDADTYVTPFSTQAALLSYGGALLAVNKVMTDEWDRAFCALRPPGHHAEYDHQMGFCIFNNIAGAARYAIETYALERVAIIDFDVHHGNGTQWAFYEESSVHFTSLHQWPFYPGTGAAGETGRGNGSGFNLNLPLFAGTSGKTAIEQIKAKFLPAMEKFRPQLILVSAGFDAHREDPLASLNFEDEDFGEITGLITSVANQFCSGKIVSLLEGGYNLAALARSAEQHVKGLLADD